MDDFNKRWDNFAVYLPSIQKSYAKVAIKADDKTRTMPKDVTMRSLNFINPKNKLWHYKYALYSAGQFKIGETQSDMVTTRDEKQTVILGDSGGFQIGKGTLKGLRDLKKGISGQAAVEAWGRNYDAKVWIVNWLENHCDYAMTLDMPLWAMSEFGVDSPFHNCSEEQLLSMTLENLMLIERERQGRTKWLNVIQGTNAKDTLTWWNAVKWFKDGGWSLAGAAGWRGGLYNVLSIVLRMRDEGAFEPGRDWVHMLGVSQPKWDIFLTAIQRQLRHSNPNIQISCDSASPFESGGARDQYAIPPALGKKASDWKISYETLTAVKTDADRTKTTPSPLLSPLGRALTMRDLVVDDSLMSGRRIDKFTNAFLMNHNAWIYLDAGRRANDAAFNSSTSDDIPSEFTAVLEIIETAFTTSNWASVLDTSKEFLVEIAPNMYKG